MLIDAQLGHLSELVTGRCWDPDQMQQQVARRIASYQEAGLQPGDRVLILFGNRLEFFAELLAIWSLGACAIPVDSRLTAFEIGKLADAARPRLAIVDGSVDVDATGQLAGAEVFNTHEHPEAAAAVNPGARWQLDDDALILFTSGSTGEPKGVVHTHRSLQARWTTLRQSLGLGAFRRSLCVLPTHFGHGLICNCLFPWLSGCDLFIGQPFRPDLLLQLGSIIDEHKITFLSSVPSMWALALRAAAGPAAGSLQRIHVGSAPLSENVWRQIQDWAGIRNVCNAYGITETGSWVAGASSEDGEPQGGLIGEAWGAQMKVLRARSVAQLQTDSGTCGPGEEGMIWLNTPALMKGYFQRQDLTDAVVFQGWFMTGDIGVMDEQGRVLIRGRERDEINKGGMKIFPADIDAVVEQHDAVTDACTFATDDPNYGENVALAVVMNDPSSQAINSLHQWIGQHLAEHKRPVLWYLMKEIPRTSRGKINRDTVREGCTGIEPVDLRKVLAQAAEPPA
jgi:acyl-CoA synthetase (AMP-forming)/AMP-acid ligase II